MPCIQKAQLLAALIFVSKENNKKQQAGEASTYHFANLHPEHMAYGTAPPVRSEIIIVCESKPTMISLSPNKP